MRIFEYKLVSAGDMSGNITSNKQQLNHIAMASIQAVYTGSPVGTLKLQISNDDITWTDYSGSGAAVSGAGDFMWNISNVAFPLIRVVYTKTSGSGSLDITVNGKGV